MRLTCRRPGGKHSVKFSRLPETGMSRSSSPSSRPVSLHRVTVSAAYPLFMLGIGHERGLEDEVLLAGSGLNREMLTAPDARVTVLQYGVVTDNLLRLTGDPAIGIELGLRSSLTKVGMIGFGLMSCATYRDAIELGLRYLPIRVPYFSVQFRVEGERGVLDLTETFPLGPHRALAFEYFMVELRCIYLSFMNPETVREYGGNSEMWFMHDEPAHFAQYRDRLPSCRFGMPVYRLLFDARQLDLPLRTANPEAAALARAHCERELALLGIVDLPSRVRALLVCGESGYPSVEDVAARLCVSPRTLKRRLQAHGQSFSGLLEEVRKRDALRLLAAPGMTVTEAAARMGYSNRVNFSRAFKGWMGVSPGEYLRS